MVTRYEICLRDGKYEREYHLHNECEICYIIRGTKGVVINDETFVLETGNLLFINRQILHRTISISDDSYEYFIVRFSSELPMQWQDMLPDIDFSLLYSRDFMLLGYDMLDHAYFQEVLRTLSAAYNGAMINQKGLKALFNVKFSELMIYLVFKTEIDLSGRIRKKSDFKKKRYEALKHYIAERGYNVSLEDLSNHFYLSRYYICHLFKEMGGMTISHYINMNKIRVALQLLESTDLPIASVGEKSGFNSFSQFGRTFHKFVEMSPREYRNRRKYVIDDTD